MQKYPLGEILSKWAYMTQLGRNLQSPFFNRGVVGVFVTLGFLYFLVFFFSLSQRNTKEERENRYTYLMEKSCGYHCKSPYTECT